MIRLSGGDVAQVWRDGDLVLKRHPSAPPDFFAAEAGGLRALAAAGMRVPQVHEVAPTQITMQYMAPGPPDWPGLADQLVRLHTTRSPLYGWPEDVFLGTCRLPSGTSTDWTEYWSTHRILPLVRQCAPLLGPRASAIEAMLARVELPVEGAVLLHGDLWSGNVHMSAEGAALIDPSVWNGERAVDLAMMQLFGGFSAEFWHAYEQRLPLSEAVRASLDCYQLYYLLAHVVMFGRSYLQGVDGVLRRTS